MCFFIWALNSIPLVCVCVFLLIPCCLDYCSFLYNLKLGSVLTSGFVLLSQDCFGYLRSFVVPYKYYYFLFNFFKNVQQSIVFLYTNNETSEKKMEKNTFYAIVTKILKYLGIKLTNNVKDLYMKITKCYFK